MATVFVKVAPERRVLNHQRGFREFLPEGESVTLDKDVRRRLADGDLVECAPPASAAAPRTVRPKD